MAKCSSIDVLVAAGLGVCELAALLGVHRVTVYRWRTTKEPDRRAALVVDHLVDLVDRVGAQAAVRRVRRVGVVLRLQPGPGKGRAA